MPTSIFCQALCSPCFQARPCKVELASLSYEISIMTINQKLVQMNRLDSQSHTSIPQGKKGGQGSSERV